MVNAARVHARRISAACIMAGHLGIVVLALVDRLVFVVPSSYPLLVMVSINPIWVFIHASCAAAIALSLIRNRWHVQVLSMSSGWMGVWGLLNLIGGMTTPASTVSLAGPVLAIVLAGTAYSMAMAWAVAPTHGGQSR